jgi:choline dehydrogenase
MRASGMTYIRPQATQIKAWSTSLQNPGWDWESLWPYYLKSESFTPPTPAQITSGGASYKPAYHGRNGPVNVGYQYGLLNGTFASLVNDTWQALSMPFNADPNGGELRGFFVWPQTVEVQQNVRGDACRAYLCPVRGWGNLFMLRGRVDQILWAGKEEEAVRTERKIVAEGVQYTDPETGSIKTLLQTRKSFSLLDLFGHRLFWSCRGLGIRSTYPILPCLIIHTTMYRSICHETPFNLVQITLLTVPAVSSSPSTSP